MTVKKKYSIGDAVWIYGISKNNVKSTQGKVIHSFTLGDAGWSPDIVHYVIEVPTEIEPLLEVRTWETISQSKDGHVGSLRLAVGNPDSARKMLSRVGITIISNDEADDNLSEEYDRFEEMMVEEDDEISPDQIHAAIAKSQKAVTHTPLDLKEPKPRRRYFKKKPKA